MTYIINNIIYPEEAFTEQKFMDTKFIHSFSLFVLGDFVLVSSLHFEDQRNFSVKANFCFR